MNLRSYFDLSQPVTFRAAAPTQPPGGPPPAVASGQEMGFAWQVFTYFVLVFSIVASRFLDLYRAGVAGTFHLDWAYLLFISIAALLAFPVVYDKARLTRGQPVLLQIGLIFSAGMGWEKIVATAVGK